jgi:hypothetical protein
MGDNRSTLGKYVTVLIFWLVPVVLILIPLFYPDDGYLRDILVLPVLLVLLYMSFILSPMFRPLRNLDFFDDIPETIERFVDAQRARKDARGLIRLYDGGHLPNVYELTALTPFQKELKSTLDKLRSDAAWHVSNAEVSRDLLERLETLMRTRDDEEVALEESVSHARKKGGKRR